MADPHRLAVSTWLGNPAVARRERRASVSERGHRRDRGTHAQLYRLIVSVRPLLRCRGFRLARRSGPRRPANAWVVSGRRADWRHDPGDEGAAAAPANA